MRKVSKKLMFIDIEVTGETNENTRESLIFKFWEVPELYDLINRGSDKLHVGDIVTFFGAWDDTAFSVSQYTIMVPWSSVSEGLAFTPVPPATVSTTKRKVSSAEALCKFFVNTGRCDAVNCAYKHTDSSDLKQARAEFVRERKDRRLLVHEENFDSPIESASKRAEVLSNWIVETYGAEYLAGGTVLDVAGGRGDLAFELAIKKGINCVVVDPRPAKLKRWQAKLVKKKEVKLPEHHQLYFDQQFFSSSKVDPASIRLVVGMHPDEATESIVDTSLSAGLPCCVVPCCVFSALSPQRRLKNGCAPINYEDFCSYLCEKSERIMTCHLPFAGKNKVLFTRPRSSADSSA